MPQSANAVLARVRSMYGKRLTQPDYSNLLSCAGVTDIANYLKTRTGYGDIFAPNAGTQITEEALEFSLNKEIAAREQKICAFEKMIDDKFFDYYILRSDIKLIIAAARTLVSTASLASSYMPSDFFNKHSALNVKKLYNAKTAGELIEALRHTRYYAPAKRFINADGVFDYSMVETHLTRFYAAEAKKMSRYFDKSSAKDLCRLIDLEIDVLNISNIFRLKKLGTNADCILPKLIFEHGTVSKSALSAMLHAQHDSEFVELLNKTTIGKGFRAADLIFPERVFETNLYAIHKHYLRFCSNPDIAVTTYLFLLKTEVDNITHIVEGKRYKLPNEEIKKFLIGVA